MVHTTLVSPTYISRENNNGIVLCLPKIVEADLATANWGVYGLAMV